ncbi:hypothetical protein [Streptomyces aureus]
MHPDFVNAVEMLPMPRVRSLTPEQIEGAACPWCAIHVDGDAGLRLGPRIGVTGSGIARWFPRACRPCVGKAAARVYRLHVRTCARCSHRDYCPDSKALHALAQECR